MVTGGIVHGACRFGSRSHNQSFLGRYDKNIFWHFSEMKLNFFDKHHPSMLTSGALTEPVVHQNTCT